MQHRSQSIILRRIPYGEADWIVTFFARDKGRMSGIAKSARRSMRRFGGALEPGTLVTLSYSERRGSDLSMISEAFVERPQIGNMKSLERIGAMTRALELALSFLQEHQPSPDKFDLLNARLEFISGAEPSVADTLEFELAWLRRCGFGPQLAACSSCGCVAEGNSWTFDFAQGGVACPECAEHGVDGPSLAADAVDVLRRMHEGDDIGNLKGAVQAGRVLGGYIDHILGRPMRQR